MWGSSHLVLWSETTLRNRDMRDIHDIRDVIVSDTGVPKIVCYGI